jgi:hypothetical protein
MFRRGQQGGQHAPLPLGYEPSKGHSRRPLPTIRAGQRKMPCPRRVGASQRQKTVRRVWFPNSFPLLRPSERWFATGSMPDQVNKPPAAIVDRLVLALKTKSVQHPQRRDVPCPHG